MKKLKAWLHLFIERLKSKTPPFMKDWGAFIVFLGLVVGFLEVQYNGGRLPDQIAKHFIWIRFIYSAIVTITPYLATQNKALSEKTPAKVVEEKKQEKKMEQEIKERDIFENIIKHKE